MLQYTACLAKCDEEDHAVAPVVLGGATFYYEPWWHDGALWVLENGAWVRHGTFRVDCTAARVAKNWEPWGTFEVHSDLVGAYSGTWVWHAKEGYGCGREIGRLEHRLAVVLHGLEGPPRSAALSR